MSRIDLEFMNTALKEAQRALEEGEFPVGAVVVLDEEVISRDRRSAGESIKLDHAEMRALSHALGKGDAEKKHVASLTDRVRLAHGEPQIFDTQFHLGGKGRYEPQPIEGPEHLEERKRVWS